jgi:hypothetical protein
MFGTRALLRAIAEGPGASRSIGPQLIESITRFASEAPQADDMTLICFGRLGPDDPPQPVPMPPESANALTGTAPG